MPSSMIHLMLAEKAHPNAPTEYFIGNIAPDAIAVRENHHYSHKDKLHFRGSDTRLKDIEDLAKQIDISNPYCEGYITHLFLDMCWDKDCLMPYISSYPENEWIIPYRQEIHRASAWLYDSCPSLKRVWGSMISYDKTIDKVIQSVTYDEVQQFYLANNTWYHKYKSQPSTAYPNDFLDRYTDEVAKKYLTWINTVKEPLH